MCIFNVIKGNISKGLFFFILAWFILSQEEFSYPPKAKSLPLSATIQQIEHFNSQQNYEASVALLLNALAAHPNDNNLTALFKRTFSMHIYNQISSGYKQIKLNPRNTEAYLIIARSFGFIGDETKALEILLEGTCANPESTELWIAIGNIELKASRDAEALSVFNEALLFDSQNSNAHNNIAYIQTHSADKRLINLDQALKHAIIATNLEPDNSNFLDTLAEIKFQLGQTNDALSIIKKAVTNSPESEFFKKQQNKFENALNYAK
ncbi:MAG: hypothetical protein O2897_02935 [bacterium]|nr:hypothetical protein [bacterium]